MSKSNYAKENRFGLRPQEKALYEHIVHLIEAGKSFRAYGSWHSKFFHSAVFDSATMIDMRDYVEQPLLDKDNNILTVSAGMAVGDIRTFLAHYNLRIYGTPESKYISIGGAALFGAHHGTGYWDALSDYVVDMLIVDGTGKLQLLTKPQLFVNYGLLGIVLRVRIKVFPAKNLEWKHTLLYDINKVHVTQSTYSLFFGPYSGRILQTDIYPTDKKAHRSLKRILWDLALWPLYCPVIARFLMFLTYIFPSMGLLVAELFTREPDAIRDKFDYFESVPRAYAYTLEYALDQADFKKAYKAIMQVIAHYRQKKTYVIRFWCRFQNAAPYVNDLAFDRPTVLMEVTLNDRQKHARAMVHDISQVFLQFNGRPHLGKTVLEPEVLKNYDFTLLKQAIKKYDPEGRFQNSFTKVMLEQD